MLLRANPMAGARPLLQPRPPLARAAPYVSRARRRAAGTAAAGAARGGGGNGGGGGGDAAPPATEPPNNATRSDPSSSSTPSIVLPPTSSPFPDVDARERALLYLTDAEADERVDAAAGLLSVLDDLRPLDKKAYSASEHVWASIAEIPPTDRVRLLGALEAGGCRQMWRHTVGRYALPRERAERAFRGYTVWRDLPPEAGSFLVEEEEEEEEEAEEEGQGERNEDVSSSGSSSSGSRAAPAPAPKANRPQKKNDNNTKPRPQVVDFEGVCERLVVESAPVRAARPGDKAPIDLPPPSSAAADLRPRPGRALRRVRRFRFQLFRHARTGQPYARVVLPSAASSVLFPGLELPGPSCYCRLDFGIALTPVRRDAGAEITLAWPSHEDPDLGGLTKADLPQGLNWPAPVRWSEDWKRVRRGFGGGWWRAFTGGGDGTREEEADGAEAGATGAAAARKGASASAEGWSPFSWTDRDYVRPAGPGVYVGCGYRPTEGLLVEDDFVWFALAKKVEDGDDLFAGDEGEEE